MAEKGIPAQAGLSRRADVNRVRAGRVLGLPLVIG
jgi:hypothetical protein